jgi:hypothetical protein
MLLVLQYKLCQRAAMRGNMIIWQRTHLRGKWYYCHNMYAVVITYDILQWIKLRGKCYYCHGTRMVAITYDLSQQTKLHGKRYYGHTQ